MIVSKNNPKLDHKDKLEKIPNQTDPDGSSKVYQFTPNKKTKPGNISSHVAEPENHSIDPNAISEAAASQAQNSGMDPNQPGKPKSRKKKKTKPKK
jgi:hypothetical protein